MKTFLKKIFLPYFLKYPLRIKNIFYFCHRVWRDGRVVERGGLENR